MNAMAFQIAGVSIVCSTVGSGADQRKQQSSASLVFVRGIRRWPVNSPHKWPVTRKMFPFDYVIMYYVVSGIILLIWTSTCNHWTSKKLVTKWHMAWTISGVSFSMHHHSDVIHTRPSFLNSFAVCECPDCMCAPVPIHYLSALKAIIMQILKYIVCLFDNNQGDQASGITYLNNTTWR